MGQPIQETYWISEAIHVQGHQRVKFKLERAGGRRFGCGDLFNIPLTYVEDDVELSVLTPNLMITGESCVFLMKIAGRPKKR